MKTWTAAILMLSLTWHIGCKGEDSEKDEADKAAATSGDKAEEDKASGNKAEEDKAKGDKTDEAEAPAPAIEASPADLYAEWKQSKEDTKARYQGKNLSVEGTIKQMGRDMSGADFITLETVKGDFMGMKVSLKKDAKQPWATMAPGQKVKVTGSWPEFSIGPELAEAEAEAVGDSPAITVEATALLTEFSTDKTAAGEKYEDKTVLVTGVVKEKRDSGGAVMAVIDGGAGTVTGGIGSMDKWAHKLVEPGKPLTMLCGFSMFKADAKDVSLFRCLPVAR